MFVFEDYYGNQVRLSFADHPFAKAPDHVWIVCRFQEKWLLTDHRERGLEFPGGKIEARESPTQAAVREVLEETGGVVDELTYIGQYKVGEALVKNIYFANIKALKPRQNYLETNGPVLLTELPTNVREDSRFSFIMKDEVLVYTLAEIKRRSLCSNAFSGFS
ncbi:8-oxo-dGTP diphosphatase [Anoxybacillus voinovskiensis]|uniref:8-oxo-dGTP diphosphatase n=1 Tax=Anoxybacteroides voinovskiense TaxID=230470 RepID=A0A840DTY2_9BACL|nr:nucleoside triphosphatase YtkD [Anoxybacillus voinovskiensis]MBB4075123.1 8-oxo-dGTP diphosphatase [Anoxybacillus voinovskiensis]